MEELKGSGHKGIIEELTIDAEAKIDESNVYYKQNFCVQEGVDWMECKMNWDEESESELGVFLDRFKKKEEGVLVKIFNVQILLAILHSYCFSTRNNLSEEHANLTSSIEVLSSNFHLLLSLEIPKKMSIFALGGYRSLLGMINEILENLLSIFTLYFHTTLTNTQITVTTKAFVFTFRVPPTSVNKLGMIKQKLASQKHSPLLTQKQLSHLYSLFDPPYHLLLQVNQGFPIILQTIPVSDTFPFQDMKVVTTQHAELMAYRHQRQIYQLGYYFNNDLSKFLHQLNIFFMSANDSLNYNHRIRYVVFGASVPKYAVYPAKYLFVSSNEVKRTVNLELLRVIWNVLEDPMMRWFSQKSGYLADPYTLVDRVVGLRVDDGDEHANSVSATQSMSGNDLNDMVRGEGTKKMEHEDGSSSPNSSNSSPNGSSNNNGGLKKDAKKMKRKDNTHYNKRRRITGRFMWHPKNDTKPQSPKSYASYFYSPFFGGSADANNSPSNSTESPQKNKKAQQQQEVYRPPAIVLHIHGGGFVSQTTSSHTNYLKEWAAQTGLPILSIDYRLAPEYPFPCAHYDCWRYYQFILNHYEDLLQLHDSSEYKSGVDLEFTLKDMKKIKKHKRKQQEEKEEDFNDENNKDKDKKVRVILVGDSAGGNLIAGLTLYAIHSRTQLPESVVMVYPATLLDLSVSISRLLFSLDPLLNHATTSICIESYVGEYLKRQVEKEQGDEEKGRRNVLDNFVLNPGLAKDELLKEFPPTYFFVGALDPLLDDSFLLAQKLRNCGRPVKMKIYNHLPHGFLNLGPVLGPARPAVEDVGKALEESLLL